MDEPSNSFTEGQKAIIEKVAYAVGDKMADRVCKKVAEQIELHSVKCPVKTQVEALNNQRKGMKTLVTIVLIILTIANVATVLWARLVTLGN